MLHSNKFVKTIFLFNEKECPMEYDLSILDADKGLFACFGNIYAEPDKDPLSFTYFVVNHQIGGYTPMNGKKEFISAIVQTTSGLTLPFSDLAGL
jgi:hypothetical protein